jgi:hypothetical protein
MDVETKQRCCIAKKNAFGSAVYSKKEYTFFLLLSPDEQRSALNVLPSVYQDVCISSRLPPKQRIQTRRLASCPFNYIESKNQIMKASVFKNTGFLFS